jgi:hypothetical protein
MGGLYTAARRSGKLDGGSCSALRVLSCETRVACSNAAGEIGRLPIVGVRATLFPGAKFRRARKALQLLALTNLRRTAGKW